MPDSTSFFSGNFFSKNQRWIQLTIISSVIIIIIALVVGWCTGDTSQPGNSLTLFNHPNASSCITAAGGLTTLNCVVQMTTGANGWAAAQTCTPRFGCAGCTKITTISNDGSLECISDGQNRLNLVCYNFTYDLDCDC
ncbi:MAG: hypothetical protein IH977_12085 [Nitrospinae bacterium]|nr:hypothetical protein [Nitrospinota bacterium]